MSSPCLSGGGRTYGFEMEMVKSPLSTSTRTSHPTTTTTSSSSPSSTISESSNSPLAISTRKPRTPRKRRNQTYNEAAALLSTAYPGIFSTKHLTSPYKFTKYQGTLFLDESPDLLFPFRPFDNSSFLLHQPRREKPSFSNEPKVENLTLSDKSCQSASGEVVDSPGGSVAFWDEYDADFDAESILDEEVDQGMDSIMGNLSVTDEVGLNGNQVGFSSSSCGRFPLGLGIGIGIGIGIEKRVNAMRRRVDEGNWWSFPIVDMLQISPRLTHHNNNNNNDIAKVSSSNSNSKPKSNKKNLRHKKKVEKSASVAEEHVAELVEKKLTIPPVKNNSGGLLLKLNYDNVLNAWSDRGSPFSDDIVSESEGNEARLAQIDLFSENGLREASVLRYKEKRLTRLFSKKIRYQVRKVNADQRPRMKGRFVRRSNSSTGGQR